VLVPTGLVPSSIIGEVRVFLFKFENSLMNLPTSRYVPGRYKISCRIVLSSLLYDVHKTKTRSTSGYSAEF
jgi:hypothetical protein